MTYLTKEDWNKYIVPKLIEDQSFREEFIQIKKVHNILLELINKFFPGLNNQMHQYKMESQEGLRVIAENKVNMYHQYDCQNSKASADKVTK